MGNRIESGFVNIGQLFAEIGVKLDNLLDVTTRGFQRSEDNQAEIQQTSVYRQAFNGIAASFVMSSQSEAEIEAELRKLVKANTPSPLKWTESFTVSRFQVTK